jgi:hypothetical protein
MTNTYRNLNRDDFDAIVTGELTHQAVWLEGELETAIVNYFAVAKATRPDFRRLMLQRDGVTFQTKIDLVRSIISADEFESDYRNAWKSALSRIEELKRIRNAMAHGRDFGGEGLEIKIGYVSRAGKDVEITIKPDSHTKLLTEADGSSKKSKGLLHAFGRPENEGRNGCLARSYSARSAPPHPTLSPELETRALRHVTRRAPAFKRKPP